MSSTRPTIFALSSGRGPAAIAVVRISGARAGEALKALTAKSPLPRQAALVRVRDPQTGESIDQGLALFFPGPRSETGEDVVELQLHGGRAVVAATLEALGRLEGLRPAEAGEFTRRAFENGKLDLTAVEGLADLVAAETEGQRRQAFRQMTGALREPAEEWRQQLIRALALVEARIDFSDEGDVPEDLVAPALTIARALADEISRSLADQHRGERLREGLVVAIAGPPNAGKSTLLNRIARREAAIVSPYAGTTRDVIEVHLDLDGWPVTLLDTAGIRETGEPVEMEGVRRAKARAAAADLVLWVVDAGATGEVGELPGRGAFGRPDLGTVGDEVAEAEETAEIGETVTEPATWLVRNKIDLAGPAAERNERLSDKYEKNEFRISEGETSPERVKIESNNEYEFNKYELEFNISAISGAGVDPLLSALTRHAETFLAGAEIGLGDPSASPANSPRYPWRAAPRAGAGARRPRGPHRRRTAPGRPGARTPHGPRRCRGYP